MSDTPMFRAFARATRLAQANGLSVDPAAFDSEQLTIVDRPEPPIWPYLAFVISFGMGTVVSIEQSFRQCLEEHPPDKHYQAAGFETLRLIGDEAERRGVRVRVGTPELGWTLAEAPARPSVPAGFELRTVDQAWLEEAQHRGIFENGAGSVGEAGRSFRNQYGSVLFGRADEPVAVGGVFLTSGLHEIGVDVVRAHRGRGFGCLVVAAATREILARGETPAYWCATTNTRSQRTALSCGYLPVLSSAFVVQR